MAPTWRKRTNGASQTGKPRKNIHSKLCQKAMRPKVNKHYRDIRKIDPASGPTLGDGTPNDANRMEIGPTQLAYDECGHIAGNV